jgi:two-component system KDP operon response regulator KdpE
VDDDLDYVHSMALIIRAFGCEADFAINATAALPAARRFRPHVVLLDVGLPDGDGRKLARPLKQEQGLDNPRIYCVTARAHEERVRSLEAGVTIISSSLWNRRFSRASWTPKARRHK